MFRKCPLEPLARRRRMDQSVKKDLPVPVGQDERLMLRDRPPGGVGECGHAEIRELASLEERSTLDQSFGGFVDSKAKPFFAKLSVRLCCRGHGRLLHQMYVN
jgi:hypothetical protein